MKTLISFAFAVATIWAVFHVCLNLPTATAIAILVLCTRLELS